MNEHFVGLHFKRSTIGWLVLIVFVICVGSCTSHSMFSKKVAAGDSAIFIPAPFPRYIQTGIQFPTERYKINAWVKDWVDRKDSIHAHAWGLWAGLTSPSGIQLGNQELMVYETWLDIQQLTYAEKHNISYDSLIKTSRYRSFLTDVKQLSHSGAQTESDVLGLESIGKAGKAESVKYNVAASKHVMNHHYLNLDTMQAKVLAGDTSSIRDFPANAITIKPTYYVLSADSIKDDRYFLMYSWPGDKHAHFNDTSGFGENKWGQYIWIDTKNRAEGNGGFVTSKSIEDRTSEATYNLSDFLYFEITNGHAQHVNATSGSKVKHVVPGDIALLVGMHVTTKEIKRWTWQTYWWSANPDYPEFPSDPIIASYRKQKKFHLSPAAKHYATAVAYNMIKIAQPISGGYNIGHPQTCFNPYLEAGFGASVFKGKIKSEIEPLLKTNKGVRTNCMSCHALATAKFVEGDVKSQQYVGDRYIDMKNYRIFKGYLKLDFLWSIQSALEEEQDLRK